MSSRRTEHTTTTRPPTVPDSIAAAQSVEFDPQSQSFAQNPYDTYAALRSMDEPCFYDGIDGWLLSRYQDVEQAARNAKLVRSLEAFMPAEEVAEERRKANWHDMPNHSRFVQFSLLESDGEVHFRLRLLVLRELSRAFVERQRGMIQSYVDALLDQLLEQGEIDFVADLASHVPGHIIGNVLGVPDADCPQLRIWSENVVQYFDIARAEEHKLLAEQATTEFYHYLLELIAQREKKPGTDLTSTLIAARNAGEMNETELISTCMLILMAGHGSTIDVLGSGMHALLRYPDELARLRKHPEYIHTAVQEMFRFESPLPYFHRYATEENRGQGPTIPERRQVRPALRLCQPGPDTIPGRRLLQYRQGAQSARRFWKGRPPVPWQPPFAARYGGDLSHAHETSENHRTRGRRTSI